MPSAALAARCVNAGLKEAVRVNCETEPSCRAAYAPNGFAIERKPPELGAPLAPRTKVAICGAAVRPYGFEWTRALAALTTRPPPNGSTWLTTNVPSSCEYGRLVPTRKDFVTKEAPGGSANKTLTENWSGSW